MLTFLAPLCASDEKKAINYNYKDMQGDGELLKAGEDEAYA